MIITENIKIDGKDFVKTYSSTGLKIESGGVFYNEAVDPAGSDKEYVETNSFIIEPTDEEYIEAGKILMGVK